MLTCSEFGVVDEVDKSGGLPRRVPTYIHAGAAHGPGHHVMYLGRGSTGIMIRMPVADVPVARTCAIAYPSPNY